AIALCEEIIERSGGNRFVQAMCLSRTAGLQAMQGDAPEGRSSMARARAILTDLGQALPLAHVTQEAGLVELFADDPAAAEKEFGTGVAALAAMGEQAYLATSEALMARAVYDQQRYDEAFELTERAEQTAGDDAAMKVEWGPTRARVLARRGETDAAVTLANEALAIASEPEDILSRGHALEGLAETLERAGKDSEAAPHWKEALQLYETKGIAPLIERVKAHLT
ncbi:MAG: hypothetical protein ABR579_02830, partial [Actinomycetota bacterium]